MAGSRFPPPSRFRIGNLLQLAAFIAHPQTEREPTFQPKDARPCHFFEARALPQFHDTIRPWGSDQQPMMTLPSALAWVISPPLPLNHKCSAHPNSRRRLYSRTVPFSCTSALADLPLSTDQKAIGDAAINVTHLLSRDPSSLTTLDLLAFCNVKGIPLPQNIWDRTYLESAALRYHRDELLARTKTGPAWEQLNEKEKIKLLHDICNGEGDATYIDPATGYTVFSFFAHLKRGHCCGIKEENGVQKRTHRCRHCPYKDDGTLGARMLAAKDRVPLTDYVRKTLTESWQSTTGLTLTSKSDVVSDPLVQSTQARTEKDLRASYARVVKIESRQGESDCDLCSDERIVTCTRCNGWTFLISPKMMECPQCSGNGYHPCITCTAFRPPQRTSFYS